MNKNEIVLFETTDNEVSLQMQDETVWLTQAQMIELFGRDVSNGMSYFCFMEVILIPAKPRDF